jgi:hypothetical protein
VTRCHSVTPSSSIHPFTASTSSGGPPPSSISSENHASAFVSCLFRTSAFSIHRRIHFGLCDSRRGRTMVCHEVDQDILGLTRRYVQVDQDILGLTRRYVQVAIMPIHRFLSFTGEGTRVSYYHYSVPVQYTLGTVCISYPAGWIPFGGICADCGLVARFGRGHDLCRSRNGARTSARSIILVLFSNLPPFFLLVLAVLGLLRQKQR